MRLDNVGRRPDASPTFRGASPTELHAVQGGFWPVVYFLGVKALIDYLVKLATDSTYDTIPIEPLN